MKTFGFRVKTMRSAKILGISVMHWLVQTITICRKEFIPPQNFGIVFRKSSARHKPRVEEPLYAR